jgi:hypothetical protein
MLTINTDKIPTVPDAEPTQPTPAKKSGILSSMLAGVKWAVDHMKALTAVVAAAITLGASAYASLKPEKDEKAGGAYDILKAPVEEAVNKTREHDDAIRELRMRVDFQEKLLAASCLRSALTFQSVPLPAPAPMPTPLPTPPPKLPTMGMSPVDAGPGDVDGDSIIDTDIPHIGSVQNALEMYPPNQQQLQLPTWEDVAKR